MLFRSPILLIVGGIVLLAVDVETVESVLVLIAGIGLMLCGINSLVQMFLAAKAPCDSDKAAEKANVVDITADDTPSEPGSK